MTLIALPPGFKPRDFSLVQQANQRSFSSPFGGSEQVVDMLNDRWVISMTLPARLTRNAAPIEAFLAALRGMTNTVNLHHFVRPVPRGTMRGVPTASAALQGAASLTLATTPGATLFAGDMIGVVGLLLQVQEDATANGAGVMVVNIVNRLRKAVPGGSLVTWDKPSVPFRMMSGSFVQFVPGFAPEVPIDFAEVVS